MKEKVITILNQRFSIPYAEIVRRAFLKLTFAEKLIVRVLAIGLVVSTLIILFEINQFFVEVIPVQGGTLTEGLIGSPRFINPLLSISDADRDLTALIYSGLLKTDAEGRLIPDLAKSYEVSPDGLTYTFILRDDVRFHDGVPVTSDDIEFTIEKAKDGSIKSPKRANWDSVLVTKINEKEIEFTLRQPYAPFLENATMGILPKHIWRNATAEEFALSLFNIEPVGSGPYKIKNIRRNSLGIPDRYELSPFENYPLGAPHIEDLRLAFYPNENSLLLAYNNGDIDAVNSISPERVTTLNVAGDNLIHTPLPRIFAVFFNQNQAPIFADKAVRAAFNMVVDREKLVKEILGGYGVPADGPIPYGILRERSIKVSTSSEEEIFAKAKKTLSDAGWKAPTEGGALQKTVKKETQTLKFSVATGDAPELREAAAMIKGQWEKLGAEVTVKIFEPGDLNQNIIRPRKYDALLFGEIIGRDLDLFAFWHSSQRNDPGLNVAMYTNAKTDKLLTDARTLQAREERLKRYATFEELIQKDVPAIFLYSPEFIYLLPNAVKGLTVSNVTIPSDRFNTIQNWYIESEKVWTIFSR